MLDKFIRPKKEEKKYIVSFSLMQGAIDCALWSIGEKKKVEILGTTHRSLDNIDKLIAVADSAISELEEKLPPKAKLCDIVFGLMPSVLEGDAVKQEYLNHLKKLTRELDLKSLGFVEMPQALSHFFHQEKGSPQTIILIGLEKETVTVSVFKVGKNFGSKTVSRSEDIAQNVESAIGHFTTVEVLPSQIILYGEGSDCEMVKQTLLQYPWQQKANFLHFPKVEILDQARLSEAVSYASVGDLVTKIVHDDTPKHTNVTGTSEEKPVQESIVTARPQELGFTQEETQEPQHAVENTASKHRLENQKPSLKDQILNRLRSFYLFTISHIARISAQRVVYIMRTKAVVFAGVMVMALAISATGALYWTLPRASVAILVDPQKLEKETRLTIDPTGPSSVEDNVLSGKLVDIEVKGEKTIATSGKKNVGEKAKGEVTIYNKTSNKKTFKKGSIITSSNDLLFTLDDDATVASASEEGDGLKYGKKDVLITAKEIGPEGNLDKGSEFTVEDYPKSSYSAKNNKAFSGGTSREVSVVSRDDQKKLAKLLTDELEQKATEKLSEQLGDNEALLSESLLAKKSNESFAKEPGEEAKEVLGSFTISYTALLYKRDDLLSVVEQIVAGSAPEGYEIEKDKIDVSVDDVEVADDGLFTLDARFSIQLLPIINTEEIQRFLAGKTIDQAKEYLSQNRSVVGVEIEKKYSLPFLKNRLPVNAEKITIATEAR